MRTEPTSAHKVESSAEQISDRIQYTSKYQQESQNIITSLEGINSRSKLNLLED